MATAFNKTRFSLDKEKTKSLLTYAVFFAVALVTVLWGQQLSQEQNGIRVWDFTAWLLLLVGLPFILVQREAGLPEAWQASVPNTRRIGVPLLIGLVFGALDIVAVKLILHPELYESLPPFLQPFPYSIFLYTSGAFEVEVFYRLIPLTLLLLVVGRWMLKGRHDAAVFWAVAVLASLREPIEQWQTGALWFVVYAAVSGFLFNLLQALYFRRAGFLASLAVRLGHYLLWHIALGLYVEYIEIGK